MEYLLGVFVIFLGVVIFRRFAGSKGHSVRDIDNGRTTSAVMDRSISEWESGLKLLKKASGEVIEFSYDSSSGRKRRKINLNEIWMHSNGMIYLKGFCHDRQQERIFSVSRICTMLKIKSKRVDVDRYLEEQYDVG